MMPEKEEEIAGYYEELEMLTSKDFWEYSPITNFFDVISYESHSKGRRNGRKIMRKYPKEIILLKPRGYKKYACWDINSDRITKSLRWDEWAQEIYGEDCSGIEKPSDRLREELKNILDRIR